MSQHILAVFSTENLSIHHKILIGIKDPFDLHKLLLLQKIVIYMKFPKDVRVVGWGKWAILPQFCTTTSFIGMHFLEILHVRYI